MKRSKQFVDQRRARIMRSLQLYGELRISFLAEDLEVSTLTIRRDVLALAEAGLVEHRYGRVILKNPLATEFSSTEIEAKRAIAKAAAALCKDGETILINTSSTALMILQYLKQKRLTVVTNNARVLDADVGQDKQIILTGGELRHPKEALIGDFAMDSLRKVVADRAFIGCSGISVENGVSTAVLQESSVNRLMMERAREVTIVADHTKIGHDSRFNYGSMEQVHRLVTDRLSSKLLLKRFMKRGTEILVAEGEDEK